MFILIKIVTLILVLTFTGNTMKTKELMVCYNILKNILLNIKRYLGVVSTSYFSQPIIEPHAFIALS